MDKSPYFEALKQYIKSTGEIIKSVELYPAAALIVTETGRKIKAYSSYKTIAKEPYIYLMEILPDGKKKRIKKG